MSGVNYNNLATLVSMVISETQRPDLAAQTQNAVLAAVLDLHTRDFFYRDIQPAQVVFDTTAYLQQLDTSALPRFRSLAYCRKWTNQLNSSAQNPDVLPPLYAPYYPYSIGNSADLLINIIDPSDLFDTYGYLKTNVGYQVGDTFNIKSNTPLPACQIGWYTFPNIDASNNFAGFSSWIALMYPYAVVYLAVSKVLNGAGLKDVAATYYQDRPDGSFTGSAASHIRSMMNSNVQAQGS